MNKIQKEILTNNYVVYHLHDDTSNCNGFADSCSKYDEYISLAKENNMKAIAFSNHGGIYDWVKKKQACDNAEIKYIHGVELYTCINLEDNNRGWHIGLYAKNLKGVRELNSLTSKATSKGILKDNSDRHFYFNPRISFDELMNTSDNIIITSACLASPLWKLGDTNIIDIEGIEKYNYNIKKRQELLEWMSKNNHRCFLEIQYHNCDSQKEYNKMLYEWSILYGIPLIAGTDTHSSSEYKAECRKVLQKSKNSFYGEEDEFDLTWKNYDDLVDEFKKQNILPIDIILEAINNTNKLAAMVEDFTLDKTFKYPDLYGENANQTWKDYIDEKLFKLINVNAIEKEKIDIYKLRVQEEYEIMCNQGMASFMLFVAELVNWCKDNDIHVSPCRGSVGGSLIAYITGITDVDAIRWKTAFSRFCNADRISLGDIDLDFSPSDRQKVYEYIINRFGKDKVSYILTFQTIKDRGSIDVLAKGLNYDNLNLVKNIKDTFDNIFKEYSKIIIEEINIEELEGKESKSPDFIDHELYLHTIRNNKKKQRLIKLKEMWDELREHNKDLFYYFDGIRGVITSKGTHPAGMIGSPITLYDNLGVFYKDGNENSPVSFCTMKAVDSLNYVKFDILGLKTIGIIQDTYRLINKEWKYAHEINWNDKNVWEDINRINVGIFQFEGDYAFDLLSTYKAKCVNDMSLVNASLRPSGKSYRERLINREFNKNPSEEIDELLKDNNGFLVFQEDTIKFLTDICDFDGSLADTTRRAIGKKDDVELEKQLPKILNGYCKHSNKPKEIAEKEAKEFIQIISDSSEYQFGYNHSTGYSMNGYICGMLRYYYPLEFTTSYLNWADNEEDLNNGIKLAKEYGIEVKNCKFRYSRAEYFMDKKTNTIYKGISSIKYLNTEVAEYLYSLRNNEYNTFTKLLIDLNKNINSRQLEILIKLNFFEEFGKTSKLLNIVQVFSAFYEKKQLKKTNIYAKYIEKFANRKTEKMFMDVNILALCEYMEDVFENKDIPIEELIKAHYENVGSCNIIKSDENPRHCIAVDINTKYSPKITFYNIRSGRIKECKIKKKTFKNNPIKLFDKVYLNKTRTESKKRFINDDYVDVEGIDIWVSSYWIIE